MTKAELLEILAKAAESGDTERAHVDADNAILDFINDTEIRDAFSSIQKWYA